MRLWGKKEPHSLLVGMQTGAATVENSMEVPQKLRIELPHDPAGPLLGIYKTMWKRLSAKRYALLCSLQHYSWWPRHENSQSFL